MYSHRPVLLGVLLAILAGCSDQTALEPTAGAEIDALVAGTPDEGRHPNVGLVAFDVDGESGPVPPFALCTGSVLSDGVFLTAAHCIRVAPRARWAVTLEPGSPEAPIVVPGTFPDDFPFPVIVPMVYADEVVVHPRFDQGHPQAHDVAVLLFPEGTFSVPPVELPEEGALDALAAQGGLRGQDFTLVGYGAMPIEGEVKNSFVAGYRQVTRAPFQALTRDWLVLQMATEATLEGALCAGDSGSPHFLGNSNLAMAIAGAGGHNEVCGTGVARSQRLDTAEELDFLAQFLAVP
jgi:hypothetical protein